MLKLKSKDCLILYYNLTKDYENNDFWLNYLNVLPDYLKKEITGYLKTTDRIKTLFGKYLVYTGFLLCTGERISFSKYLRNEYGKPFVENKEALHFNISHCDTMVACVFSYSKIGIDIEQHKKVNYKSFSHVFLPEENQKIMLGENAIFYKFWTIKEAVLKAEGKGFFINPLQVKIQKKCAMYLTNMWYYKNFLLKVNTTGTIVSNKANPNLLFAEMIFN